jgi:CubicO group peptidase (beta-lactamase class C family)
MAKNRSKIAKKMLKVARVFAYFLVFIFISLNLFVLLSGRTYLYKGIANTYLKGKSGPGIYDLDIFAHSTIPKAKETFEWNKSKENKVISSEDLAYLERYETSSYLVIKDDEIIFEKYWGDHTETTVSNSFSAAKTLVALLVGVAIQEGKIKSMDDLVGNYLPEFNKDGKEIITIRDLLLMSSGLDWEESGKNPLSENAESYYGKDLYRLATNQKRITEPHKLYKYQSGNSQLLGFVVEKATGKNLSEYMYEKIWSQIGTKNDAYWSLDKENGDEKSFCCFYATTQDFARIGRLIYHLGNWEGTQLIPKAFMEEMIQPASYLTTEEGIPNYRYGIHIWTYVGGKHPVAYCRGILGQYIFSIPEEKLIIVRTGAIRAPHFKMSQAQQNNPQYYEKNKYKIGHPNDIFKYIFIAEKMNNN